MVVFLVCWLPYHLVVLLDIFSILHYIPFTCQLEAFLFAAFTVTQCLSLVHCCTSTRALQLHPNRNYRYELMKAFIFKYSSSGPLQAHRLQRVETEYSALGKMPSDGFPMRPLDLCTASGPVRGGSPRPAGPPGFLEESRVAGLGDPRWHGEGQPVSLWLLSRSRPSGASRGL